eukprot:11705-Heterococcus_DN1.PRE.2
MSSVDSVHTWMSSIDRVHSDHKLEQTFSKHQSFCCSVVSHQLPACCAAHYIINAVLRVYVQQQLLADSRQHTVAQLGSVNDAPVNAQRTCVARICAAVETLCQAAQYA